MIASLSGKLTRKSPEYLVIDVSGVGYQVHVPLSTYYRMPDEGGSAILHIHTHLREDTLSLYGFSSRQEKELFLVLLSVSGIGPKLGLTILSSLSAEEIVSAIGSSNHEKLSTVPGIGKKTAARMVLELKDKMKSFGDHGPAEERMEAIDTSSDDVLSALVNLGYKKPLAEEAIRQATKNRPGLSVEALIRESLGLLMKR